MLKARPTLFIFLARLTKQPLESKANEIWEDKVTKSRSAVAANVITSEKRNRPRPEKKPRPRRAENIKEFESRPAHRARTVFFGRTLQIESGCSICDGRRWRQPPTLKKRGSKRESLSLPAKSSSSPDQGDRTCVMTEHSMTVSPWGMVAPSARRTMRVCPEVGGQG